MTHDCHFNDFILIGPATHDFTSADVSVTSAKADGATSAKADGATSAKANGATSAKADGATSAKADGATSAKADGATSAMRHRRRHRRQSLAKKGERERD